MSSEYDRPERDGDETACAYTSYDDGAGVSSDDGTGGGTDNSTAVSYEEKEKTDGPVPATGEDATGLERLVWEALYLVEDPEMPISIVDLGLIYGVSVDEDTGTADVEMTLTYTGCPARDMLVNEVTQAVAAVDGVEQAEITLVWSPGWTVEMVTEQGRESLREFGLSV